MSSRTREQLERWIRTKVFDGKILDVGGSQLPINGRINFASESRDITILDLPNPHELKKAPDIEWDLNKCIRADYDGQYDFERKDLFGTFDNVVCLEVTEYLWNPVCAMKNLALFLKEGGRLFISFHFIYPVHNPADVDFLRYTPSGARKLLEEAGFEIVEETSRLASGSGFSTAFAFEGMRPARGEDHSVVGILIEAKKK